MKEESQVLLLCCWRTCWATPAQWEGFAADGRRIYARWGDQSLRIYVGSRGGKRADPLRNRPFLELSIGFPGAEQAEATLKKVTAGQLCWPDAIGSAVARTITPAAGWQLDRNRSAFVLESRRILSRLRRGTNS